MSDNRFFIICGFVVIITLILSIKSCGECDTNRRNETYQAAIKAGLVQKVTPHGTVIWTKPGELPYTVEQ
jgi:hypothetical protein